MKKIICTALAMVLSFTMCAPTVLAAETVSHTAGTRIEYEGKQSQTYTVTVPAQLAIDGTGVGTVTATGYWDSSKQLVVTAPETVVLEHDSVASENREVTVTFEDITLPGSDSEQLTAEAEIAVEKVDTSNMFFGKWTGVITYTAKIEAIQP